MNARTPEGMMKQQILRHLGSRDDVRIFCNFSGRVIYETEDGKERQFKAGLTKKGSSDLIGFQSVVITEEMVGQTIAVFLAIEVKKDEKTKPTEAQWNFIRQVRRHGGLAGKAGSLKEAEDILWNNG